MPADTKTQQGFTLIELLVVVAIIGMLSVIVMTSLSNVRKKSRDAKRKSDIQAINTAIQLYIDDNGHAPYLDGTCGPAPNYCYTYDFDNSKLPAAYAAGISLGQASL
ncbi:MAG TPA: type II secretion system protein, partial [bacterium]|nr:type II secretion system protein [bacterium]